MLVKFVSSTAGEMVMFAQHVRDLFQIIDKECTQRGVFMKEQLPEAIGRLQRAVDEEKLVMKLAKMSVEEDDLSDKEMDQDSEESPAKDKISLIRRAPPLIHFMELTQKENGFILWETEADF
ncbi:MAG: DUF1840 domain-containing protein [Betaproteobacteria bacterium]